MTELSHISGPEVTENYEYTIPGLLAKYAQEQPHGEAYVIRQPPSEPGPERSVVTFGDLDQRTSHLAARLLGLGLQPGDRVAAFGATCLEWLYLQNAAMKVKLLLIPLSGELENLESLTSVLNRHCCVALFLHPGEEESIVRRLNNVLPGLAIPGQDYINECGLSSLKLVVSITEATSYGLPCLHDLLKQAPSTDNLKRMTEISRSVRPEDDALAFSTSGSTGQPKVVVHTHRSLCAIYLNRGAEVMDRLKTRFFNDRSFSWMGACTPLPVICGCTVIYVDTKYTLRMKLYTFVFNVLAEEKVTSAILLPYMLWDIIDIASKSSPGALAALTMATTVGERMSEDLLRKASAVIPSLDMAYGCTEVPPIVGYNLQEQPLVGRPKIGAKIKIVGDHASIVPRGTVGEIVVHAPSLFSRYLDNDEQTAKAKTEEGWFHTKDLGKIDSAGGVHFIGRMSELISKGTRKIYPAVVERWLKGFQKVGQCVVVGVPDPRLYEEVCAVIVPVPGCHLTAEEVQQYTEDNIMGDVDIACVPRYIKIVSSIPMINLGKIDRAAIRKMAAEEYGEGKT